MANAMRVRAGVLLAPLLIAAALAGAAPAQAATKTSARYLLSTLGTVSEHTSGYDRSKFTQWVDADGDGCDTRDEVLISEAVEDPSVRSGCDLSGGNWRSKYDGATTTDPSTFDIDHLVPLNEAWQSGAWKWNADTRRRFANDLGYKFSLIAVTASSNRSKGDREPQDWMPERPGYACTYVKQWVAVKWRWRLAVNRGEREFLRSTLRDCGWPRVLKPSRASIGTGTSGGSGGDGDGGGGSCEPGYSPCVPPYPPDLDCSDLNGPIYVTGSDPHRLDGDGDGVACE